MNHRKKKEAKKKDDGGDGLFSLVFRGAASRLEASRRDAMLTTQVGPFPTPIRARFTRRLPDRDRRDCNRLDSS
jgi:hypothetical protein